jgi:hypothetical protein
MSTSKSHSLHPEDEGSMILQNSGILSTHKSDLKLLPRKCFLDVLLLPEKNMETAQSRQSLEMKCASH